MLNPPIPRLAAVPSVGLTSVRPARGDDGEANDLPKETACCAAKPAWRLDVRTNVPPFPDVGAGIVRPAYAEGATDQRPCPCVRSTPTPSATSPDDRPTARSARRRPEWGRGLSIPTEARLRPAPAMSTAGARPPDAPEHHPSNQGCRVHQQTVCSQDIMQFTLGGDTVIARRKQRPHSSGGFPAHGNRRGVMVEQQQRLQCFLPLLRRRGLPTRGRT